MYLAKELGGWSTTQIGRFYNRRDHSTVCYAVRRIQVLRDIDPEVDGLLTLLRDEIGSIRPAKREHNIRLVVNQKVPDAASLFDEELLDWLAEQIASRVFSKLAPRVINEPVEPSSTPM
jgi:hypothetical protein